MHKHKLMQLVNKIENLFNNGFKEYIILYLTRLSNSITRIEEFDVKHMVYHCVDINFNRFKDTFDNMILNKENENKDPYLKFYYNYTYTPTYIKNKKIKEILFGYNSNFSDIISIIDYVLLNKDKLKDLTDKVMINEFCSYLQCLMDNLYVLSVFFYREGDNIDNIPEDINTIINREFSNNVFDIDSELIKSSLDQESYSISDEAASEEKQLSDAEDIRNNIKKLETVAMRISGIINNTKLTIKNFLSKIDVTRKLFYKKYLGRIDHLYNNYASNCSIMENDLIGDPADILINKIPKFATYLTDSLIKLYENFNKHIDSLFSCKSLSEMINSVNKYLTLNEVKLKPEATAKDINKALLLDLRYKVAKILLKNIEIYGYTSESIVHKKYPPLNHVIVSMFVYRPHEKPTEKTVSTIFSSPESFKILDSKFDDVILKVSSTLNTRLMKIKIPNDVKKLSLRIKEYKTSFNVDNLNANIGSVSITDDTSTNKTAKRDLSQRLAVLKNHENFFHSLYMVYIYLAGLSNSIYTVALRIDKTAQNCITALLKYEKSVSDSGYNSGVGTGIKKTVPKTTYKNIKKETEQSTIDDSGNKVTKYKF